MADKNVDEVFAEIIAHWDDSGGADSPRDDAAAPARPEGADRPVVADAKAADRTPEPTVSEPIASEPTASDPTDTEPTASDRTASEPTASEPTASEPTASEPTAQERTAQETPAEVPWPVWRGAVVPVDEALERADLAAAEADDTHFEPGPLAPLPPTEDLHFWGIVVGLVAGPLLLLWLVIVRPDVSGWWTAGAVALTVGGFALLVLRQPATRDSDDPDNGARV